MEERIRQLFIAEARTAARTASTEPALKRGSFDDGFGIFAVSLGEQSREYAWEVRKCDGSVLERSNETFQTILLARYAGLQALAGDEGYSTRTPDSAEGA